MSDYLSPLLFVMEDEFEVFWCFAALMERVGPNFNRDQSGMHAQLFALSKVYAFAFHTPSSLFFRIINDFGLFCQVSTSNLIALCIFSARELNVSDF